MIPLSWQTALARKSSLAGSFVALALSVGLLGAMTLTIVSAVSGGRGQPRWFTQPTVVVAGGDTVSVTTGSGDDRETETVRTAGARAVPAELAARLAGLAATSSAGIPGVTVVTDYAGYGQAPGAPGQAIHPWAAAGLHRYQWLTGGPPRGPGQIVLTAPARYRPGQAVVVQTAAGPRRFTVSGVIRTAAQPALYATGAVASQLAGGQVSAVALTVPPAGAGRTGSGGAGRPGVTAAALAARVRAQAQGLPVQVLTGTARRDAEPDPDGDLIAVAASLLGTTSGLAGFVSVVVLASTFAYGVAARRREFGLLRTVGATPRQVRRMVLGEALAVGVAGALAGAALAPVIARPFARWLARNGFAPAGLDVRFTWWPVAAAFGAGLLIALAGSFAAARRAGWTRPAEALREAAGDRRAMTPLRWIAGLAALAGVVPLVMVFGSLHTAGAEALFLPIVTLLITGAVMLLPALIPPLTGLAGGPFAVFGRTAGFLARRSAATSVRRTAAVMTPVLLTVGFAGAMLSAFGTITTAQQGAAASRVTAPAVATPGGGAPGGGAGNSGTAGGGTVGGGTAGIADSTVARIAAAPGVTAAVPVTTTTVYVRSSGDPDDWTGEYLPGPRAARVLRLPLVAGSLAALRGTGTVAVPAGRWHVGQFAQLWLGDSTPVRLRVVAVYAAQLDLSETVLLPWALRDAHTAPLASAVYLRLAPGAGLAGARAAAQAGGATVTTARQYLTSQQTQNDRVNHLAVLVVLGMALLYTAIAIANTLVMTIGDRAGELAVLRLSGATRPQVLQMLATEAGLITAAGTVLAAVVTAVTVISVRGGLAGLAPSVPVVIPWRVAGAISAGCLLIALAATLLPAAAALRRRPAPLAGLT